MMGGMDPRQLKNMMSRMGIKSSDIDALRVTIECRDKDIVIEQPQVTLIEAQGVKTFQIAGPTSERQKLVKAEINQEDVDTVKAQTGIDDDALVRKTLEETNGDIAAAIRRLRKPNQQ